jgi:hypothetical protein
VSVLRFEMSREPGAAATGFDILHHHRRRRATRPASTLEAPGRGPVQAGSVNTSWAASCQTELAQTCVPASFSRADRRRQGGYEAPRAKASCGMLRISDRKAVPLHDFPRQSRCRRSPRRRGRSGCELLTSSCSTGSAGSPYRTPCRARSFRMAFPGCRCRDRHDDILMSCDGPVAPERLARNVASIATTATPRALATTLVSPSSPSRGSTPAREERMPRAQYFSARENGPTSARENGSTSRSSTPDGVSLSDVPGCSEPTRRARSPLASAARRVDSSWRCHAGGTFCSRSCDFARRI